MLEPGMLYICATPIGNLGDITLRVLETLRKVDLIAAEDTRHSRKLLEHYSITTPLTSYHEHNEKGKALALLAKLKDGQSIALISDAGMPGISDPGAEIIRLCRNENIIIDVLPGPNAAITALLLSGLPAESFAFHGFMPSAAGERRRRLEAYAHRPETQIFYEAPHRLLNTLKDMAEAVGGNREGAVVRELTKIHQSVHRGELNGLVEEFTLHSPRGECCILLAPYVPVKQSGGPEDWLREVDKWLDEGLSPQEAMKEAAKEYGVSKRDVYRAVQGRKESGDRIQNSGVRSQNENTGRSQESE